MDPITAQKHRRHLLALIVIAILASAVINHARVSVANELQRTANLDIDSRLSAAKKAESTKPVEINAMVREVSAYNAGDPQQTDDSPCISANGEDLCMALALGQKRCAANFVPFGTRLHIENFGECLVVDRMNRRYKNRVDIAMNADEKQRALKFGVQNLVVKVLR